MSVCTSRIQDDVSGDVAREIGILYRVAPCGAEAVSAMVHRALRDLRSADGQDSPDGHMIYKVMIGVVRGTLESSADAFQTARGAVMGVLKAALFLRIPVRAVFGDAAKPLILETSAMAGPYGATVLGVLDAGLREGVELGMSRQEVLSVVSAASAAAYTQRGALGRLSHSQDRQLSALVQLQQQSV